MKSKLLRYLSFFIFPIIIFCFAVFFYLSGIYTRFSSLDIPLHFLGGISIAYVAVLFLREFEKMDFIKIKNSFLLIFIITSFVCLVAIFWELWEYFAGHILQINFFAGGNLADTLFDLFLGFSGGIVGASFSKV